MNNFKLHQSLFSYKNVLRKTLLASGLALFLIAPNCYSQDKDDKKEMKMKEMKKMDPKAETKVPMKIMPSGSQPDWGPTIDPQMLAVIEQFQSYENPSFKGATGFQYRNIKLPANAVMDLLHKTGIKPMESKVDISHKILPVGDEGVLVRMYKPKNVEKESLPVIVYYHGGGWVIADLDTYEASAVALAEKANAIVVSVAYRQGPEHKFPTAHEDSFNAYKWVVENTAEIGGNPNMIATAGESAGGNLAVAVALMAKDRGVKLPVHIVSVYPIADGDIESPSYEKYANAVPLNKGFMKWFFEQYVPNWSSNNDPLINLIDADLSGLPATTIINAEIDPLENEGKVLAEKMKAAGIDVERKMYEGVTHEFFGMSAVLEQAVDAQKFAVDRLMKTFKK
ncbi:alpha/beta hydrolase [Gillisia limnaea]|uniref:Esterase/lipase n=2 Tax=Gillisia TaxID=244698 RepID=H2BWL9_GILLR|nr:alpha/beta hydrolase [Gillisia limnaea]EHQ02997.1 esterase/lipase [Gillisia limnaea DSM 15749]